MIAKIGADSIPAGSHRRFQLGLATAAIAASIAVPAHAQVNMTTQQNDIYRSGQNLSETTLNTANVASPQFGKLYTRPVLGAIFAQPLYLSNVLIHGEAHNVVYVATQSDHVYAFDANSDEGSSAHPLWQATMLSTAHGAASGARLYGKLGILGTPVIDPTSNSLYLVSANSDGGAPVFRLHALDVASGVEKFGGPVVITATAPGIAGDAVGGVVTFDSSNENQRAALLLLNGTVYVSFAASLELQETGWHGWVLGYNATTLAQTGAFCLSPNGVGGGVWMSGNGLAADQLDPVNQPDGRMFLATGNGDFSAAAPYANTMDFGDSVLALNLRGGAPAVADAFAPSNQTDLDASDSDQGSGGVMVLPPTSGSHPHLLVQTGKSGILYLLDRDNLGGYNATGDQVVQAMAGAVGGPGAWSSPAYWNGNVYYWGAYDTLKSFPLVNGLLTAPTVSTEKSAHPGSTPAISANAATQGIVWTINSDAASVSGGPAILLAHDAANVSRTLYSSSNLATDQAGNAVSFTVPTIANGTVFVGALNELDVYGLIKTTQTSAPTLSPASSAFVSSVSVSLTDATPNAVIYYTTDGSAATPAATRYTAPIPVTSAVTINAVATAPKLAVSYQSSAIYTPTPTAAPTFSPPAVAYSSAQSVTLADGTPGAAIYYTTDNSTPTTASARYRGPLAVTASETLKAMALAPGYTASGVALASYLIVGSPHIVANYAAGFTSTTDLFLNGVTTANHALRLSAFNSGVAANAVWQTTKLNVQKFTTDFDFQETNVHADGFTFILQNDPNGLQALGAAGGGLGYEGIGSSVAVKFDLFNNSGEGVNSTGVYVNGATPTIPAVDMGASKFSLRSPHILHAHLRYDGTTLSVALTDTVSGAGFNTSSVVDIPAVVGSNTAYVGFTAGTSGTGATQTLLDWTYESAATH